MQRYRFLEQPLHAPRGKGGLSVDHTRHVPIGVATTLTYQLVKFLPNYFIGGVRLRLTVGGGLEGGKRTPTDAGVRL